MINLGYLEQKELVSYPFIDTPKDFPKDIIVDIIISSTDIDIYLSALIITDELISCVFESANSCYYVNTDKNCRVDYIYNGNNIPVGLIAFGDKLDNCEYANLEIMLRPDCIISPLGLIMKIDNTEVNGDIIIENDTGDLSIDYKHHDSLDKDALVIELNTQFAKQVNEKLLPNKYPFGTGCKIKPLQEINGVSEENIDIEAKGLLTMSQQNNTFTLCCDKNLDDICPKDVLSDIDSNGNVDVYVPDECSPCE